MANNDATLIVASMGASAVLLFAVPHGALSQPWPLVGGHFISAVIGVTCYQFVSNPLIAAPLAVSLAIAAMHYLRCIHPPGGATALTAVIGSADLHALGYQYVITPVLFNALIILLIAIAFNALFSWRRYPVSWHPKTATLPKTETESVLSDSDLEYALKQIGSFIDVVPEDLAKIYALAMQHSKMVPSNSLESKVGHYYSNGQYGHHWSVRQIIAIVHDDITNEERVSYKIIVGKGRRTTAACSRQEFAQWAKYEVFRNENSWQQVEPPRNF